MKKLSQFVSEHISDDTTRLLLNRKKWPETDMETAVECIESRRKLKGKVPQWYGNPDLVFPRKLSAEQCSSSATALYKSELAEHISIGSQNAKFRIADLTGGLGVDSWFFSKKAEKVLYNEMQGPLCEAATYNFKVLGAENIMVSNHAVASDGTGTTPSALLREFVPDIVYMDPARRGEGGKKVFLIEECTPDVLTLKDEIFGMCRHMLIKLSPMADISMACGRLGSCCREVHVVSAGGECKELLVWMDREWTGEYETVAVELDNDGTASSFRFKQSEEKASTLRQYSPCQKGSFLFEPGKALMKAGAFNMISHRFDIGKFGHSTHYYTTDDSEKVKELKKHGKIFRIIDCQPLDKRSIKAFGKEYPQADVTARNIPMTTETLRKKLGCGDGGTVHIFGLKSDKEGALLIAAGRI